MTVYGPQPKRIYKPKPDAPRHALPGGNTCGMLAPCGGKCIMDGRHRHQYHTCVKRDCLHCHDARFGRVKVAA